MVLVRVGLKRVGLILVRVGLMLVRVGLILVVGVLRVLSSIEFTRSLIRPSLIPKPLGVSSSRSV